MLIRFLQLVFNYLSTISETLFLSILLISPVQKFLSVNRHFVVPGFCLFIQLILGQQVNMNFKYFHLIHAQEPVKALLNVAC